MQVPGKLNQRTICDFLHFFQQLGGVSVLVSLRKTKLSVCLFEKMTVEWDRPASKRQSAVGRASINKQPLAPGPFKAIIERRTVMQPEQTKGRRNRAIFRHGPHRLHRTAVSFKVR